MDVHGALDHRIGRLGRHHIAQTTDHLVTVDAEDPQSRRTMESRHARPINARLNQHHRPKAVRGDD
jgi:hypothetical protein